MNTIPRHLDEIRRWIRTAKRNEMLLVLICACVALGLMKEGWERLLGRWREFSRPKMRFQGSFKQGVAVSLNGLEQVGNNTVRLPGFRVRGMLWDRKHLDWVIFGDAAPGRSAIPVDAIVIALRAVRQEVEAPGVDIRATPKSVAGKEISQKVTYFGGVSETAVGDWFFQFDYWMKRKSLGLAEENISGVSVYWNEAVSALEREVETCGTAWEEPRQRYNRYWLQTGEFTAIEGDDTLVFERTPLEVAVESRIGAAPALSISVSSTNTEIVDPLAAKFAQALNDNLSAIGRITPISQIQDFASLMAGFTWLSSVDSFRDLRPWLKRETAHVETPKLVSNLVMRAAREHPTPRGLHRHTMELSGGVLVRPSVIRFRVADESLGKLRHAILEQRPNGKPTFWQFFFEAK